MKRIFSPTFFASLVTFVGSALGLGFLHDTVIACTAGFRASAQPLTVSQAAMCPGYEVGAAALIVISLVAGAVTIWSGWRSFHTAAPAPRENAGSDLGPRREGVAPRRGPFARILAWPTYRWVCLLVGLFFTASFFANAWGYFQLGGANGGVYDLSINQQALSSPLLGGKPYLFYEAINCGRHGQCSFLQVHQAFIGFAVAAVYGIAPSAFTLFALQSLAMGLAALPLYALAVDVLGSRRLSLVVVGAYLSWVPAFIATSFSFHWEAFIPVEMFTLFWLWSRQKYLLAIPVVFVAFVTLEVTPVLVFFVGLYFLWPWLWKGLRLLYSALFQRPVASTGSSSKFRLWARWVRTSFRVPEVYASLALMAGCVVAYVLLRLFVLDGGWLLGLPPVPSAYALPLSSPNKDFAFNLAALSTKWIAKLVFWVVVFLTLGFIPLFAPRSLLLVLPWIIFAVFNTNPAYWILGNHYIFPATAALFIAFTFGLDRLHRWAAEDASPFRKGASTPARLSEGRPADAPSARGSSTRAWTLDGGTRTGSSGPATLLSIGVVIIIAGNLFLNPLNPLTATLVPELGKPFPVSYGVNLGPLPNGQPLERLISMIPKNAIVTAPLPVYSLVSDDPYAYPMADFTNPPFNDFLLPGNESTRVAYVLLPYNTPEYDFTPALLATLYDRSDFGVRGCVSESAAGGVELFQRNYNGTPVVFGPPDSLCPNYYSGGAGLTAGPHSSVVNNASSPSGVVVRSAPCHSNSTVWSGPGIELPAGQYGLHVVFNGYNGTSVSCLGNGFEPARALLALSVTGQNATNPVPAQLYYHRLTESSVCSHTCGSWTFWNLTITLNSATSDLSVVGTVLIGQYIVQVSYVVISTGPIVKF